MTVPVRIQRKRTRGWRMPEGAVYVGRPTKWGNPFVAHDWQAAFRAVALGCMGDKAGRNEAAVKLYRIWLTATPRAVKVPKPDLWEREVFTVKVPRPPPTIGEIRAELRGRDLACFCKPEEFCHADVLLEIANAPVPA